MHESEALSKAADLLENTGWCQDCPAVDANGNAVGVWDPEAVAWCARGALQKVIGPDSLAALMRARVSLVIEVSRGTVPPEGRYVSLTAWNDVAGRTAEEVIAAMRRAAA